MNARNRSTKSWFIGKVPRGARSRLRRQTCRCFVSDPQPSPDRVDGVGCRSEPPNGHGCRTVGRIENYGSNKVGATIPAVAPGDRLPEGLVRDWDWDRSSHIPIPNPQSPVPSPNPHRDATSPTADDGTPARGGGVGAERLQPLTSQTPVVRKMVCGTIIDGALRPRRRHAISELLEICTTYSVVTWNTTSLAKCSWRR
jgi:hypothetical protein